VKPIEFLRFLWRQLTSMRTAIFLLLLLAIASIPGSLLPQRGENPIAVDKFISSHRTLGKFLDTLKFFDVFASPWFSAIYLLLFISMIGCVLPRTWQHFKFIFKAPPPAPRFLDKMDGYKVIDDLDPEIVAARALKWLKKHHFRIRNSAGAISAEKGYLKESGNLLFHLSLILLLVGVALGSMFSTNGEVILNVGDKFFNTPTSYDSISYGRFQTPAGLKPFALTIENFQAKYNPINNAPSYYALKVLAANPYNAKPKLVTIKVNSPLTYGATKIYLQANGYSPIVTVRDRTGKVIFHGPTVFLPQDANLTSSGAIKLPDTSPQIGFVGTYVPTFSANNVRGVFSVYPESLDPRLLVGAWVGNLGLDSGIPQSVYRLNTAEMKLLGSAQMSLGQSFNYGLGTITFDGYTKWVNLQIVNDPGKEFVLFGAVLILLGLLLSTRGKQRRIWIRYGSQIEVAGLAKTSVAELEVEIAQLINFLYIIAE
jgi:cytochrome c biogenesis protein